MIKDLIVNLTVGEKGDVAGDFAVALATDLEAHATAVAFAYEPVVPASVIGAVSVDIVESARTENQQIARSAVGRFQQAADRAGISADSQVLAAVLADAADTFGRMGRRFDLCVVKQPEPDIAAPEDLIIEAALFQSGRPVVVVPYIHKGGLTLDRVMVCWDGGRTSARAIGDAMPVLQRARTVEVVMVTGETGKWDQVPGADMGHHLARHGLNVEVKRLPGIKGDVADTLLSYAADSSADFLVMGGYGHSRLREFILGGVTRAMLKSMTVPCLMSH